MQVEEADFAPYKGHKWLIALSGGADSRTLLNIAAKHKNLATEILAVYVNHHLQPSADGWEDFCRAACLAERIPFITEHVHVEQGPSIEGQARKVRYAALLKHMDGNTVLFTAHHADDVFENIILAVIRGAGISGLASLKPERTFGPGIIARPLIKVPRVEIEKYCLKNNLKYVTDPTNADENISRNFIRKKIAPLLKQRFPEILNGAGRMQDSLRDAECSVDMRMHELDLKLRTVCFGCPMIDDNLLAELPEGEQYTYMHALLSKNKLEPSRKIISEILSLRSATQDSKGFVQIDKFRISRFRNHFYIVPYAAEINKDLKIELNPGETFNLHGFKAEYFKSSADEKINSLSDGWITLPFLLKVPEGKKISLLFMPQSSLRMHPEKRLHSQTLHTLWKEIGVPLYMRNFCPLVMCENYKVGIAGVFAEKDFIEKTTTDMYGIIRVSFSLSETKEIMD